MRLRDRDRWDRVCSSSGILFLADPVHRLPPEFTLPAPTHTHQVLLFVVSARGPGPPANDSAVTPPLPQAVLESPSQASSLLAPTPPHPTLTDSCHCPRALLSFATEHVQVTEEAGGGEQGEEPAGSGHE